MTLAQPMPTKKINNNNNNNNNISFLVQLPAVVVWTVVYKENNELPYFNLLIIPSLFEQNSKIRRNCEI